MAPHRTRPTSRQANTGKKREPEAGDLQLHASTTPPSLNPRCTDLPDAHQHNEGESVEVEVATHPHQSKGQTAWQVERRPREQIYVGMKIKLTSANATIGAGRIAAVSNLCRHWVAFRLRETTTPSTLHVPIPWTKLPDFESYTHTKYYFQLPTHPLAHVQFRYNPIFYDRTQNPYEFDLWGIDTDKLDRRVEEIRKGRRETEAARGETDREAGRK